MLRSSAGAQSDLTITRLLTHAAKEIFYFLPNLFTALESFQGPPNAPRQLIAGIDRHNVTLCCSAALPNKHCLHILLQQLKHGVPLHQFLPALQGKKRFCGSGRTGIESYDSAERA